MDLKRSAIIAINNDAGQATGLGAQIPSMRDVECAPWVVSFRSSFLRCRRVFSNLPAAKSLAPGKGERHRLRPPQDDKQFHALSESRTGSYPVRRVARTAGARCVGSNESVPDAAEVAGRHGSCFNHWRYLLISVTCLRTIAHEVKLGLPHIIMKGVQHVSDR